MPGRDLTQSLADAGVGPGTPAGLVVVPGGASVAVDGWSWSVDTDVAAELARAEARLGPRWVWWGAALVADPVTAGFAPRRCWDLAAVHRLLDGGYRDDPAAVWARCVGRAAPPPPTPVEPTLLDPEVEVPPRPLSDGGDLHPAWAAPRWADLPAAEQLGRAQRLAELALDAHARQGAAVRDLPDRRRVPADPALPELTAWSESAAALLCVELARDGLPIDVERAHSLLAGIVGPRPADEGAATRERQRRDEAVLALVPAGDRRDLRNPAQVKEMLARLGFDVPDTRSWRLRPFRGAHPAIDALLAWRKAERVLTTYGYTWLDRHVGADGRLRGEWGASDGGAGRMTASAGLHSLPAELRAAVAAEPGHVLVRADLGQVEPRVLATVAQDEALAAATRDDDLYLPVAAALGVDRPTAKVGMLAAMYGQTSGTAAAVLRRMDAAYPDAMRYLRAAEQVGREGGDVRTYGGRLVRGRSPGDAGLGRYLRNAVVQGAAAELFKAWAAAVRAGLAGTGGQVVLCLHDELLLHVPEGGADEAADLLQRALAQTSRRWAGGLPVRFVADVSVVRRWSEAKTPAPG